MSEQEIEKFIKELDKDSKDLCVYPDKQNINCSDCYLCRVDFFNKVREELRSV